MSWMLVQTEPAWTLKQDPTLVGAVGALPLWEAELVNELGQRRVMRFSAADETEAFLVADAWCRQANRQEPSAVAPCLIPTLDEVPAFLRRQAD